MTFSDGYGSSCPAGRSTLYLTVLGLSQLRELHVGYVKSKHYYCLIRKTCDDFTTFIIAASSTHVQ
jgi:hypothetical protein